MDIQARRDVTITQLQTGGDARVKDNCTVLTAAASQATVIDTTSYPVASQDGLYITVTVDGGTAQRVDFVGALTTAAHLIAAINAQITGAYAYADGAQVRITTESWGATSSVAVDVGTSAMTYTTASDLGTGGLVRGSVCTYNPATGIWIPYTDVTATDGTEMPRGVFVGEDIDPHVLAAGNVANQVMAIGGPVEYGDNVIVFHNGVALTDEITNQNITVEGALASIGIFIESVDFVSQLENA
jgi:hypothetical protein